MPEPFSHAQPGAVAAGGRHGEAAGREHDPRRGYRPGGCVDRESAGGRLDGRHARAELQTHAAAAREGDEAVANVASAVRTRKQFARALLEGERDAEVLLEERLLFAQGPRAEHAAQQMWRTVGHKPLRRQH
jgi:hypothetical protein